MTNIYLRSSALLVLLLSFCLPTAAQDEKTYVPQPGKFPPPDSGTYLAGELVSVDHVNRRGGLRLDGDQFEDKYDKASPLLFALLPYGMLWYNGAPAELRDIPLGTHLHGEFYLPPAGEEKIIPAPKGPPQYVPKYNHALLLEDDFSFYQRRGQAWKIESIDLQYDRGSKQFPPLNKEGDWRKTPATGRLKVVSTGKGVANGLTGEKTFAIDRSTRLWKGRTSIGWEDLGPESAWTVKDNGRTLKLENLIAQLNLTWDPQWAQKEFHVADIWFDEESHTAAAERQRQIHIRYQHHYWLPGWIDHVEDQGSGRGIVSVTLFGGMDPLLYEKIRFCAQRKEGAKLAVAEKTLRTWWQEHDSKSGPLIAIQESENPPAGSSGIQVQIRFEELLEGYRPGRIVRLAPTDWPNSKRPPEERMRTLDD